MPSCHWPSAQTSCEDYQKMKVKMNAAGKNNRETTGGYGNLPRAEKKMLASIRLMQSNRGERGKDGSVQTGKEGLTC